MAIKSSPTFTVVYGTCIVSFPASYVPDPRRATFNEADYRGLNKGRESGKTAAALRDVADLVDAEPTLLPLPAHLTTARLRQLADLLDADARAEADLEAARIALQQLRVLNRDSAINAANDVLSQLKVNARRDASLIIRFSLLFNLHKRG